VSNRSLPGPQRPPGARGLAREVLRRVEQSGAYASLALAAALDRAELSGADKALCTELVYGVLRHRLRLDRALGAYAPRGLGKLSPGALVALRVGAYQLLLLRVPAHAAVDDAVGAVNQVSGPEVSRFANAVLRKLAAEGEPPRTSTDVISELEEVHSMPRWLGKRLRHTLGDEECKLAAEAMNRPAPVTLRVSIDKLTREQLVDQLAAERPDASVVPSTWAPDAVLLRGGGAPEQLKAFVDGMCTVQDVAAQLVARMCGAEPGEVILDACSGVGGKSTHLAQLARGVHIDAADLSRRKLDLADDTARRLGLTINTIECDLAEIPPGKLRDGYDRVLLDAPCSGLGVLRRHPESKWRRKDEDVAELAALQKRMLDALVSHVRPGGLLVYSVCTFTEEEGTRQMQSFLARHPEFSVEPPVGIPCLDGKGYLRTWPHLHDADAFFAARLRKAGKGGRAPAGRASRREGAGKWPLGWDGAGRARFPEARRGAVESRGASAQRTVERTTGTLWGLLPSGEGFPPSFAEP
jgi:16S rRNA (cytosine967-C5)-methyltransferase